MCADGSKRQCPYEGVRRGSCVGRRNEIVSRMRTVLAAALFGAMALIGRADDFPIKKFASFTWVVDYEPFWSPDGKQIVLVSSRHGGMKLHMMSADSSSYGSDMQQITFGNDEDDTPAWSPDGK